jgi:hypothetical protein
MLAIGLHVAVIDVIILLPTNIRKSSTKVNGINSKKEDICHKKFASLKK